MRSIAFICDIHLDEKNPIIFGVDSKKNWERILKDVRNRNIDEVVFGGDIGAATAHDYFFNTLKQFKLKLILGNHDSFLEVSKHYMSGENSTALCYAEKEESRKFIYLDSSSKKINKDQLNWLANEINTKREIAIFIHHPIVKVNTPIDRKHPLLNRDAALELLLQSENNITIYSGHYHMNHEEQFKNVRQIITQSSSFQVVKKAPAMEIDASEFGYRIISFDKDVIHSKIVTLLNDSKKNKA